MDAERGARDESLGNRIPGAAERWISIALVHAGHRGGLMRPCDPCQRSRALGMRTSEARRTGPLSHVERTAYGGSTGRLDRDGFPGETRGAGRPAAAAH